MISAEQVISVNRALSQFPIVVQVSTACGYSPVSMAVLGTCGLLATILGSLGVGVALVFNVVGCGVPALMTYEMLEAKEDMKSAMTYWVVFGLFTLVADLLDWLLCWIPFFFFARLAFQAWLIVGNFAGAQKIYVVIAPTLLTRIQDTQRIITKSYVVPVSASSPSSKSN